LPLLTPPWKNIFGYTWNYPLLLPPGKNPSDAHASRGEAVFQATAKMEQINWVKLV